MTYQNLRVSETLGWWNYYEAKQRVINALGFEAEDDGYKHYKYFSAAVNISKEMKWNLPHPKALWVASTMQYLNRHTSRFPIEPTLPNGMGENPSKHSLHAAYKWARVLQFAYDSFSEQRALTTEEEIKFSTYLDWGTRIIVAHDWGEVFGEASSVASRANGGTIVEDPLAERKILDYILVRAAQTHDNFEAVQELEKEILAIREEINVQETGLQPILDLVLTDDMQEKIKNADQTDILVKDFWLDHFDLIEFQDKWNEFNPNNSITQDLNHKEDIDFLGRVLKVTERTEGTSHLIKLGLLSLHDSGGNIIETLETRDRFQDYKYFPKREFFKRDSNIICAGSYYSEKNVADIFYKSQGVVENFIAQHVLAELYRLQIKRFRVLPPIVHFRGGKEDIHALLAKYHMQLARGAQHQKHFLLPIEKSTRIIDFYSAARDEILNYSPLDTPPSGARFKLYPTNAALASIESPHVKNISEPNLDDLENYSEDTASPHIQAALKHHEISKRLCAQDEFKPA